MIRNRIGAALLAILAGLHFSAAVSGAGNLGAIARGAGFMLAAWALVWIDGQAANAHNGADLRANRRDVARSYPYLVVATGALLLGGVTAANRDWLPLPAERLQMTLWAGGIVLVTAGLIGSHWRELRFEWREALLVGGLFMLALALRTWRLEALLRHFIDEANFAAVLMRQPKPEPLLRPIVQSAFTGVYSFLQNEAVGLLGHNLAGLRLPSSFFGALTVVAVYLLARAMADRPTAFLAALILATLPPHLHFSRLGLNNIADPLFGTLALAFLARADRRAYAVLAGTMLGLSQYFYEGGRLLFPVLIALGIVLLWRQPAYRRHLWRGAVAALLVAAPLYINLIPEAGLFPRAGATRLNLESIYWRELREAGEMWPQLRLQAIHPFLTYVHLAELRPFYTQDAAGFHHTLLQGTWYYGGGYALILPGLVPFFVLGLGVALRRWPSMLVLVAWLVLPALGNIGAQTGAHATRYVMALPALAVVVALGIRWLLVPLDAEAPGDRLVGITLLVALGALIALFQTGHYFNSHLPYFNREFRRAEIGLDGQDAAFRSLEFPATTSVYLIGEPPPDINVARTVLWFYGGEATMHALTPDDLPRQLAELEAIQGRLVFFLPPDDRATYDLLARHFALTPPDHNHHPDVPPTEAYLMVERH